MKKHGDKNLDNNDQEKNKNPPPNSPERPRHVASIQKAFGGALKKKVIHQRDIPEPPKEAGFQWPALRRGGRRPTFERIAERRQERAVGGALDANRARAVGSFSPIEAIEEGEEEEDLQTHHGPEGHAHQLDEARGLHHSPHPAAAVPDTRHSRLTSGNYAADLTAVARPPVRRNTPFPLDDAVYNNQTAPVRRRLSDEIIPHSPPFGESSGTRPTVVPARGRLTNEAFAHSSANTVLAEPRVQRTTHVDVNPPHPGADPAQRVARHSGQVGSFLNEPDITEESASPQVSQTHLKDPNAPVEDPRSGHGILMHSQRSLPPRPAAHSLQHARAHHPAIQPSRWFSAGAKPNEVLNEESESQSTPRYRDEFLHRRGTRPHSRITAVRSWPRSKRYSRLEEEEDWDERGSLRRTNSVHFPILEDKEKRFHELVAAGDVTAVHLFLADNPDFNVNCVSYQQTSALQVAIREMHEAMVVLLLEHEGTNACDAVLTAVHVGDLHIINTVLTCIENTRPGLEFAPCPNSADFADDVTPLMLAAREGKFEIVDLLLQRGHRMPDLHDPYCTCEQCRKNLMKYDRLKYSQMKMNLYRAVASPEYLFQTTGDPLRRAFELTGELQAAARLFPQFKGEFEELWGALRLFSAELIGCCRNADEVEVILKQPAGCDAAGALLYPRLQLAIDSNQKEFVAHPHTQAVLEKAWMGEQSEWKMQSALMQAMAPIARIPILFVIFGASFCLPQLGWIKSYQSPVNKFVSAFAGYIVFLTLLFALSSEDKTHQKRGPPASGLKYPIMLFVLGYIWGSVRLCFTLGPKRFFSIGWSWFDCAMELCFVFTFAFWFAAWADVAAFKNEDVPRRYWNAWDPTLISEGLFALATIMAFCRLYLPMSLNYYLGPLQISIGKMTLDIFRFVFIFTLLVFAWSAGLSHLYQAYDGMVQFDSASNSNTTQVSSFVNFPMTLKTFFWAIFGMAPIESADVVIENLESDPPGNSVINTHQFTEGVGYFTFAVYQFIAVVVVLNMLVACMANTFTKVIDNVSVEWVFGRTKIYLMYMYTSPLPPPFNLIPTLSDLTTALQWLSLLGKNDPKRRAKCSFTHCCYIEHATDAHVDREFPVLMSQLAQRYLRMKEAEEGGGEAQDTTKADIEELKGLVRDLSAIITSRDHTV